MNTEKLTKTLMIGLLSLGLASCTNTSTPATATENNNPVEAQEVESEDMIATSMEDEANTEEVAKEGATEEATDKEAETKEADAEATETEDADKADAETEETADKETTDSETAAEEEVEVDAGAEVPSDVNYEEGKGSYVGSLVLKNNGERGEEIPVAQVVNVEIADNTLTVTGSLDYREDPEAETAATELDNDTYNFRIDDNTVFQAIGGLAEPEYYTADEFIKFYDEVKDSGLGLIIEMEDGLVHTVSITS